MGVVPMGTFNYFSREQGLELDAEAAVLQLLEDSRAKLPEKFRDDPDTRRLLLEVMGDAYHDLNRFDVSIPLREELVALSTERLGADDRRTLDARLQLPADPPSTVAE